MTVGHPPPVLQQTIDSDSNGPAANFYYAQTGSQSNFRQGAHSGTTQHQYTCQMCNFFSNDPNSIVSHIKNGHNLNSGMPTPQQPSLSPFPPFQNSSNEYIKNKNYRFK
jgi:hypothetical protein